jgi:hypothetical protein
MKLQQGGLRVTEPPRRGDLSAVASRPEAPQQTGLSASLKRGVESESSSPLKLLAKTAA